MFIDELNFLECQSLIIQSWAKVSVHVCHNNFRQKMHLISLHNTGYISQHSIPYTHPMFIRNITSQSVTIWRKSLCFIKWTCGSLSSPHKRRFFNGFLAITQFTETFQWIWLWICQSGMWLHITYMKLIFKLIKYYIISKNGLMLSEIIPLTDAGCHRGGHLSGTMWILIFCTR